MAEQSATPQPAVQIVPMQMPSPPTQGASQFVLTMNVNEILLTIGHARLGIQPTGMPTPIPGIEWFLTLAIGPTAAKRLAEGLTALVGEFEKRFGAIPTDTTVAPLKMEMHGILPERAPPGHAKRARKSAKTERG